LTGKQSTHTGTHNPLDRNNDGQVNARDVVGGGNRGYDNTDRGMAGQGNLAGSSTQGGILGSSGARTGGTHNPADRNNDGKVDARDLNDPSRSRKSS
jgi:hypothetical protein